MKNSANASRYNAAISSFHQAIIQKEEKTVKGLLAKHSELAETTEENENGCTPLMQVAQQNDSSLVQLLIQKGANPEKRGSHGLNAFHMAIQESHESVIHFLLKQCSILLNLQTRQGETPLMLAAEKGHLSIMHFLLDQKADVALKNEKEENIFHITAYYGYDEMMQRLLKNKKAINHINAQSKTGRTPLMLAVFNNHLSMVKLLLEKGANPDLCDVWGASVIHCAVDGENNLEL